MSNFALAEIGRYDWSSLPVLGDRSDRVPVSLQKLISAQSEDVAEGIYWELENTIVVQGQIFEAGPPVVSVLMASIVDGLSEGARGWVLELLFQLVAGESHIEAVRRGNSNLGDECRARAREGLWVLYGELRGSHKHTVRNIIERVDLDATRLERLDSVRHDR